MNRVIIASLVGIATGAVVTIALQSGIGGDGRDVPRPVVRDIRDVPQMTPAAAAVHREERYAKLATIEDIQALPGEFARAEALYAVAGRADSAGVQALIFDADRIADPAPRETALDVLFQRLTELDPPSALTLSRMEYFAGQPQIERRVWMSWGRADLDAALAEAARQPTTRDSNIAAQSLYAAFGYMGNETTDRIEAELGIGPDRTTRSRFLYRMADASPAQAIEYINAMEPGRVRGEFVSWLAYYLAQKDPLIAAGYAELFDDVSYRNRFEQIVESESARDNPREVVDRLLAGGRSGVSRSELWGAFRGLAEQDVELAMSYFVQLRSEDDRRALGSSIATMLARRDIDEALAWARANDTGRMPNLLLQVLHTIAENDPARALEEAQTIANAQMRSNVLSSVLQVITRQDPGGALDYLELIPNLQEREQVAEQAVQSWLRRDPEAAVQWLLSQNEEVTRRYLSASAWAIVRSDIDAAMRLLPMVDETLQHSWRYQIAQRLATDRSAADALNFIAQFEGDAEYDNLRSAVINGLAESDIFTARRMADEMPAGPDRDAAYTHIIQYRAQTDPYDAMRWLDRISDEALRGQAAGSIAAAWYGNDAAAATQWARELPPGDFRDDAILGLANGFREYGPVEERLIDSIENSEKRGQARIRQIWSLVQTDPARARQLLEDADIPAHQRQQIEANIRRWHGSM